MKSYSTEKTVLVYTKNTDTKDLIKKVCNELSLDLYEVKQVEDIIAVPCFIMFVDAGYFTKDVCDFIESMHDKVLGEGPFILILDDNRPYKIPESFELVSENTPYLLSNKYLKSKIKEAMQKQSEENKKQALFKRKLARIIYIYDILSRGESIPIRDICAYFNISNRTLRRDVKLLKETLPNLQIEYRGTYDE